MKRRSFLAALVACVPFLRQKPQPEYAYTAIPCTLGDPVVYACESGPLFEWEMDTVLPDGPHPELRVHYHTSISSKALAGLGL